MSLDERDTHLDDGRMTLAEHLGELRSRLIKCIVAVLIGTVFCFIFREPIINFLLGPLQNLPSDTSEPDTKLLVTDPLEVFTLAMKISAYGGVMLAMPVILWQLWKFITPGLYDHERKLAVPFVLSAVILFVMGASIAFWTLPLALEFLQGIMGGDNFAYLYTPSNWTQFVLTMMVAFGVGFEFPIVLIFLQIVGLLQPASLAKWRPYAYVIIFVIVAVITPSGDPISLCALAVPMIIFYEASIVIGKIFARRKARKLAAEAGPVIDL